MPQGSSFYLDHRFGCALLSVIRIGTKSSEFSEPTLRCHHPGAQITFRESDLVLQDLFPNWEINTIIHWELHKSMHAIAPSQTFPQCWLAAPPASCCTISLLLLVSILVQPQLPFSYSLVSHSDGRSSTLAGPIAGSSLALTGTVSR